MDWMELLEELCSRWGGSTKEIRTAQLSQPIAAAAPEQEEEKKMVF
jgi:hypothetical protein